MLYTLEQEDFNFLLFSNGDDEGIRSLYLQYKSQVAGYLINYTNSELVADELTKFVFGAAAARRENFQSLSYLLDYIDRLTRETTEIFLRETIRKRILLQPVFPLTLGNLESKFQGLFARTLGDMLHVHASRYRTLSPGKELSEPDAKLTELIWSIFQTTYLPGLLPDLDSDMPTSWRLEIE